MIREIEKFETAARLAMGNYDLASPARKKAAPIPTAFWLAALSALACGALLLSLLI